MLGYPVRQAEEDLPFFMKFTKYLWPAALFILLLCGCQADQPPNYSDFNPDDTESWEVNPFYGELRFLILHQDTGEPIPDMSPCGFLPCVLRNK